MRDRKLEYLMAIKKWKWTNPELAAELEATVRKVRERDPYISTAYISQTLQKIPLLFQMTLEGCSMQRVKKILDVEGREHKIIFIKD